jgi:hypothetical protein
MANRTGLWEYSVPFALNNYYGCPAQSVRFPLEEVHATPVISQFDVAGTDPSGSRHLISHASFVQLLASGRGPASPAFNYMDLQAMDISPGSGVSKTKCFIFRIADIDCPSDGRVFDIKLWVSNTGDFLTQDWQVAYETSQTWQQNKVIPVSYLASPTTWMPKSLPENQNLNRQDGGKTIYQTGDSHVSEHVYAAVVSSGTLPLGEYGGSTSGFYLRVTYNIDNISQLRD